MESISAWMKADNNALDGAIADTKLSARPETDGFSGKIVGEHQERKVPRAHWRAERVHHRRIR
jgi:hypothetical protein